MNIKISMISVYALLCNFAFAGDIKLTDHINIRILQNGKCSWGQKEIGKETSFNVIKDINYLYYVEQNCNSDQILKNSKFYKDAWKNIFGEAEQDSLANMITKIYEKVDGGNVLKQSQINTLYYMHDLLKLDFSKFDDHFNTQKLTAETVNGKYITGWRIKEFGENVNNAINDYNTTYKLSVDNKSVFIESEEQQITQRKKNEEEKKRIEEQLKKQEAERKQKELEEQLKRQEEERKQKELEEQLKKQEAERKQKELEEQLRKQEEEGKQYEKSVSIILSSPIGNNKPFSALGDLDGIINGIKVGRCVLPFLHINGLSISASDVTLSEDFSSAASKIFFQIATLQSVENLCKELAGKVGVINGFSSPSLTDLDKYIISVVKNQHGYFDVSAASIFLKELYLNNCFEIVNDRVVTYKSWFDGFATGKKLGFSYGEWNKFWVDFWEKVGMNVSSVIADSHIVVNSLTYVDEQNRKRINYLDPWSSLTLCVYFQKNKRQYTISDGRNEIVNEKTNKSLYEEFIKCCGGIDKIESVERSKKLSLVL